jgi:hypothetical protein
MNHPSDNKSAATHPCDAAESHDRRRLQKRRAEKRTHSRSMLLVAEYSAGDLLQI